jgi:hypothetical protein
VFRRAQSYLLRYWQETCVGDRLRLDTLLAVLLGVAICEAVAPSDPAAKIAWTDLLAEVEACLQAAADSGEFDPLAYDCKLLLLCAAILRANGHQARAVDRFACELGREMARLAQIPHDLFGEGLLLSALGYCERPHFAELRQSEFKADDLLLADAETIRARCRSISAETLYGTRAPGAPLRNDMVEVLTAVAIERLRAYDLALAAVVLRTTGYLKVPSTPWFRQSIRYLERQQQRDGRFGCFSATAPRYSAMGIDVDADLYVPITVACVWTLSELKVAGFRVFNMTPKLVSRG